MSLAASVKYKLPCNYQKKTKNCCKLFVNNQRIGAKRYITTVLLQSMGEESSAWGPKAAGVNF